MTSPLPLPGLLGCEPQQGRWQERPAAAPRTVIGEECRGQKCWMLTLHPSPPWWGSGLPRGGLSQLRGSGCGCAAGGGAQHQQEGCGIPYGEALGLMTGEEGTGTENNLGTHMSTEQSPRPSITFLLTYFIFTRTLGGQNQCPI